VSINPLAPRLRGGDRVYLDNTQPKRKEIIVKAVAGAILMVASANCISIFSLGHYQEFNALMAAVFFILGLCFLFAKDKPAP